MLLAPQIFFTTQAAPTSSSNLAIWTVLITQIVALLIFYLSQREVRRKEQREVESHHEKERETLRLNMKREVFLEIAPAIQNNYLALSSFANLGQSLSDVQGKISDTLARSVGAIAKLQAVASDETIEAARQVLTLLGGIYVRLLAARIKLGERKDAEALREMAYLWAQEVSAFPPLMSSLIYLARKELHLPFDKNKFEAGAKDSNTKMFEALDKLISSFA